MERIELLKSFLEEDPDDNFSLYALALEYVNIHNIGEAIRLLENLLQKNPDYLATYYQLGKLYERQRNFARASDVFKKGMETAGKQKDQKTLNELQSALDLLEE
jgi:cytochrome c-type biogenesis protein CcmH/NrfG